MDAETVLRLDKTATPRDVREAALLVAERAKRNAASLDVEGAFPFAEVAALSAAGFLTAPFPHWVGGSGLAGGADACLSLLPVLRSLGAASLPLGRLYEGHVNAIGLVSLYGRRDQLELLAMEARGGALFGVWAADDASGLKLRDNGRCRVLEGRKILCSGAPVIARPLITATDDAGRLLMATPKLSPGERADLSAWTAQGMRASATGRVDLSGVQVADYEIVGGSGDYHRQPAFSGGAWRFAAVQLGGVEALFDCLRAHLTQTRRGGDPHQAGRLGEAAIAVETARLWVERAAHFAEIDNAKPDLTVAYVNLARTAVERAALTMLDLAHRSIGLTAFMRPNPIERISRDLATYLRQPGPDRALTSAAEWILAQERSADEVWT
jgi:alkylation response protein AidB-like acyl-CoA dehydrogenase